MNKLRTIIAFIICLSASPSISAQESKSAETVINKVEVFYFHYTRRCMTCNRVESETKKSLESLYPEKMKAGEVVFKSVNLDAADSKIDSDRAKAEGQSLLVVAGQSRTDLTNTAFMNATTRPEKLKAELQKTINPLLKIK